MAVSAGQPREEGIQRVCCDDCSASQGRVNVSAVATAPWSFLPASLLTPCLPWVQQTA